MRACVHVCTGWGVGRNGRGFKKNAVAVRCLAAHYRDASKGAGINTGRSPCLFTIVTHALRVRYILPPT